MAGAARTVSVFLHADITAFRRAMTDASRTSTTTARTVRQRMGDASRRTATTLNRIGTTGTRTLQGLQGASVGLIAVFGAAVYTAAKFEKAMSGVAAVTQASSADMARLRETALEAGRTTRYSATEAAQGMEELAKAGVSVEDIIGGGLKGVLDLAAAAEVGVGEAAEIAATSLVVFGLEGRDVSHVADLLAASANKSATDVHQMGLSMRMAAQVASQTGLSIEDTVGALTLFAAEGLKGSDAGTSFKVMLQRLTPQSKEAAAMMEELGFSAYNANGNFIGINGVAREMAEAFGQLTPEARNSAMALIFGSDAVRAANILYKNGEAGIRAYTAAVNDTGYAAAVARTRMDNLIGDLNYLKSALETALIQSGSAANEVLRDMTQWVTAVINAYNALPPGLQESTTLLLGLLGVLGLVGASMLLFIPRIALVRRELAAMGVTAAGARTAMMGLTRLGLVGVTLGAIAWGVDSLADKFDGAGPSVNKLTESLIDFGRDGVLAGEAAKVFGTDLDQLADAVGRITEPGNLERTRDALHTITHFGTSDSNDLEEAREQVQALDEALGGMVSSGAPDLAAQAFNQIAEAIEESGTSVDDFRALLPRYQEAMESASMQTELGAAAQEEMGQAAGVTTEQLQDERTEAEKLADALDSLNGAAINTAEAEIGFAASLDSLTEAVEANGRAMDITTEEGRATKTAYLEAAQAAQAHAQAVAEQTGSTEEANAVLEANMSALRETMRAAGFTENEIRELTNAYAQLPSEVLTAVSAPGAAHSIEQMETLYSRVEDLPDGHHIEVDAPTDDVVQALEDVGYRVTHLPNRRVRITAPTSDAQRAVQALRDAIQALKDRTVTITTRRSTEWTDDQGHSHQAPMAAGGRVLRLAGGGGVGYPGGGPVTGPGSSTSDSIPAWLSAGEYVIRAAAVSRYGLSMLDAINSMRMPLPRHMADGGATAPLSGRQFANALRSMPAGPPEIKAEIHARVFVGDREITDIARTEVDARLVRVERALRGRRTT